MSARLWPADAVTGAPSYTGRALRQTTVAPFVAMGSAARPLGAKSGARLGTPSSIVSATSTTWTVQPFVGVIDGEAAAIAGPYNYSFDTNQTGAVTAAAGSARIDRLDVQVSDPAESDGSSTPTVTIVYTAGVAGSGVAAAAPPRSHRLCLINVPASGGGSPTVSWAPDWSDNSGEWTFNTLAERDAYVTSISSANVPPQQQATILADVTASNNGLYVWAGSAWTRLYSGANMIVPTSVVGATVTPNGAISFSNVLTISVNGVFSSLYDNYLLVLDVYAQSNTAGGLLFLRGAGTDDASAKYTFTEGYDRGTTRTVSSAGLITTGWPALPVAVSEATGQFNLFAPALARPTRGSASLVGVASTGDILNQQAVYRHDASTAFDGFTYKSSGGAGGTLTGTLRVYGYYNG